MAGIRNGLKKKKELSSLDVDTITDFYRRIRGRLTKGEIKYDKAASGTRRCVAMPVKRPILVHFVTHPLSEPWNLVVFSAPNRLIVT